MDEKLKKILTPLFQSLVEKLIQRDTADFPKHLTVLFNESEIFERKYIEFLHIIATHKDYNLIGFGAKINILDNIIKKACEEHSVENYIENNLNKLHDEFIKLIKDWHVYLFVYGLVWNGPELEMGMHSLFKMDRDKAQNLYDDLKIDIHEKLGTGYSIFEKLGASSDLHLSNIIDKTCLKIKVNAEKEMAIKLGHEIGQKVLEIINYVLREADYDVRNVKLSLLTLNSGQSRLCPIVSVDKQEAEAYIKYDHGYENITIDLKDIELLNNAGLESLLSMRFNNSNPSKLENMIFYALKLYFDGCVQSNSRIAYLNYMMIIENILNPSDNNQLSKSMANGLAMLLGNTYKERKEIYDEFYKLYGVRSSIIHGNDIEPTNTELEKAEVYAKKLIRFLYIHSESLNSKDDLLYYINRLILS